MTYDYYTKLNNPDDTKMCKMMKLHGAVKLGRHLDINDLLIIFQNECRSTS